MHFCTWVGTFANFGSQRVNEHILAPKQALKQKKFWLPEGQFCTSFCSSKGTLESILAQYRTCCPILAQKWTVYHVLPGQRGRLVVFAIQAGNSEYLFAPKKALKSMFGTKEITVAKVLAPNNVLLVIVALLRQSDRALSMHFGTWVGTFAYSGSRGGT